MLSLLKLSSHGKGAKSTVITIFHIWLDDVKHLLHYAVSLQTSIFIFQTETRVALNALHSLPPNPGRPPSALCPKSPHVMPYIVASRDVMQSTS